MKLGEFGEILPQPDPDCHYSRRRTCRNVPPVQRGEVTGSLPGLGRMPGSIYGMLKAKWPKTVFRLERFDLLVLDEAS
jgi:hypothetical protein